VGRAALNTCILASWVAADALLQVGASEATLLAKLGIKPFSYGLVIRQVPHSFLNILRYNLCLVPTFTALAVTCSACVLVPFKAADWAACHCPLFRCSSRAPCTRRPCWTSPRRTCWPRPRPRSPTSPPSRLPPATRPRCARGLETVTLAILHLPSPSGSNTTNGATHHSLVLSTNCWTLSSPWSGGTSVWRAA
jgi:hypothetical protein